MRKKILSLVVACCMLFSMAAPALAANDAPVNVARGYIVAPHLTYIDMAYSDLSIDSGTAYVDCAVYGYSDTTKATISAKLQQYKSGSWVTIKTFSASSNSDYASLSETYRVTKGYSYRVEATVRAYVGSASESASVSSGHVFY